MDAEQRRGLKGLLAHLAIHGRALRSKYTPDEALDDIAAHYRVHVRGMKATGMMGG